MTKREAIVYLEAILEDTLEPNDERDAARIEAVEMAIDALSGLLECCCKMDKEIEHDRETGKQDEGLG